MAWIFLALLAYFIDALVFVIDKYLLSHSVPHPSAYAFYVSVLNVILVLLLLPFGYHFINFLPGPVFWLSLISGAAFFTGLLFLYQAIQTIDVAEVMPAIGAISAIVTFILSWKFLRGSISPLHVYAFMLLVIGTLLVSYLHLSRRIFLSVIGSSFSLAVSYVSLKYIFTVTGFLNALFWTRGGLAAAALIMLAVSRWRRQIVATTASAGFEISFIFILNKLLAAATFVILYYAIKIGSVVFVNAMQGVQYLFMLIIGGLLYQAFPYVFKDHRHNFTPRRLAATTMIITGLVLLFI